MNSIRLVFILLTSDPFERFYPPPFEGSGLNPLLQDPGLAFHPPLLYLGYVGLSAAFSFAAAALIGTRNDAAWVRAARPFALTAWTALATQNATNGAVRWKVPPAAAAGRRRYHLGRAHY